MISVCVFVSFTRGSYPAGAVCKGCTPGCASCEQSATNCLSCQQPLVLHKHQCVKECPRAHTLRGNECMPCPEGCLLCAEEGQCTSKEQIQNGIVSSCLDFFIAKLLNWRFLFSFFSRVWKDFSTWGGLRVCMSWRVLWRYGGRCVWALSPRLWALSRGRIWPVWLLRRSWQHPEQRDVCVSLSLTNLQRQQVWGVYGWV